MSTPAEISSPPQGSRAGRLLRYALFIGALGLTVIALLYAFENWRGRRAWDAYRVAAEARGITLDFSKLVPPTVPDDQNFAQTPFLRPLLDFEPGTQKWRDQAAYERTVHFDGGFLQELPSDRQAALDSVIFGDRRKAMNGDWRRGWPRDLVAFYLLHKLDSENTVRQSADFAPAKIDLTAAATGILDNMKRFDPVFSELHEAAKRPQSRFNINYGEENLAAVLLPHLAVIKNLSQLLSYRASANLALNRNDDALADVQLVLRIAESTETERTLIGFLVRLAILNLAVQPAWEGLGDHRWNEAQLLSLTASFQRIDVMAGLAYSLAGERGFGNSIIDYLRRKPEMWNALASPEDGSNQGAPRVFNLFPSGWFFFERVSYNELFDSILPSANGPVERQVDPVAFTKRWTEAESELQKGTGLLQHRTLARLLLPALSKVVQKAASGDATVSEVRTALALERYYLANKTYPDALPVLVPKFLPVQPMDVVKGGLLHYRRTDSGSYVLYSLGWNGVDDGGQRATVRKGGKTLDENAGDWVWSYLPDALAVADPAGVP